jgi:hypothetical protein
MAAMSKTRNNHYVPQWYQEGFVETGRNRLAYLDLTPSQKVLDDGRAITERARFDAPPPDPFDRLTYIRRSSEHPSTTRLSAVCLATLMPGVRKPLGLLPELISANGTAIFKHSSNTSTSRRFAPPRDWTG